jgi:hypothetical protein
MAADNSRVLPAEVYGSAHNSENPALYTVFPFKFYGIGKPGLSVGIETFNNREPRSELGSWDYSAVMAAYLGLVDYAKSTTAVKFGDLNEHGCRFPGFRTKGDWTPNQCHNGSAQISTQAMLMQCSGQEIRVLPAIPSHWDVDFKLHAPDNTTVRIQFENGVITGQDVNPPARANDVITVYPTATPAPTPTTSPGDVNADGSITIVDALMTSQHYVGLNPPGFVAANADVNCDGNITIVDALMIAQRYVGLIGSFC